MFHFNPRFLLLAILLLLVEILIAVYVRDALIRPYGGDFLVVIMLYGFARAFVNLPKLLIAIAVWLFSLAVELSQYVHLAEVLGLADNRVAVIVLGSEFNWWDIVAYTLGIVVVYGIDRRWGDKG